MEISRRIFKWMLIKDGAAEQLPHNPSGSFMLNLTYIWCLTLLNRFDLLNGSSAGNLKNLVSFPCQNYGNFERDIKLWWLKRTYQQIKVLERPSFLWIWFLFWLFFITKSEFLSDLIPLFRKFLIVSLRFSFSDVPVFPVFRFWSK